MSGAPLRTRILQRAICKKFPSHTERNSSSLILRSTQSAGSNRQQSASYAPTGHQRTFPRTFRSTAVSKNKKNYYDVLGVPKSATKDEIKSKYREMAKKCHPDLNKDDKNAGTKFRELSEAYEVLENDAKRQRYDQYGSVENDPFGGRESPGGNPFGGFPFGGFGGGGFGGGGFRSEPGENVFDALNRAMRQQEETMGQDVRMKTKLSFLEAVNGCNKDMKYEYMDNRNGKSTRKSKTVNVDIPPGVDTGVSIKMSGSGIEAIKGTHKGNLLIELEVEEDPYFKRENHDIYTDQQISLTQVNNKVADDYNLLPTIINDI